MRLQAEIEVVNRSLATLNQKGKGRKVQSCLAIGRKNEEEGVVMVLSTNQNRAGVKYAVRDNIQRVFHKFLAEGKATISLKVPPHDLCISAKNDVLQLKSFLGVLKKTLDGTLDESKLTLSALHPVSASQVAKPKTKLRITSKKDYPITTSFPHTLTQLHINEINLKRFDNRILKLRNLVVLDLGQNLITDLNSLHPLTHLEELHLPHNRLTTLSPTFCRSVLQLKLLDLSNNALSGPLPEYFCHFLEGLVTLKIDSNDISRLPNSLGKMKKLKYLGVSSNKLSVLPGSIRSLRLESLDVSGNPLLLPPSEGTVVRSELTAVASLKDIAATVAVQRKLDVGISEEDIPGHLLAFLKAFQQCPCGRICFSNIAVAQVPIQFKNFASSHQADQNQVVIETALCSEKCLSRYKKNPYAL